MPLLHLPNFVIVKSRGLVPMHSKVSELAATPFKKLDIPQLDLYNDKGKIFD